MCIISDYKGVLGLGGIIGGTRSGTELDTKNVFLEAAHFNPRSIRSTAKKLNIETDAKFRNERGIDPLSIDYGLKKAALLIKEICGGEISNLDIQKVDTYKTRVFKVIITGGFSDLFKNSIKTKAIHNQDITIKGLIKISKLI